MKSSEFGRRTWNQLQPTASETPQRFDQKTISDLPAPAQRYLRRALPPDTPLATTVELEMTGRIRLGSRWLPFTATQILHAAVGFVWRPTLQGRAFRIVGADQLGEDGARMEFRLFGLIPVARASGPDVARSAAGRLAAETVAWVPQALAPQAGGRWTGIDHQQASVSISTPEGEVEVQLIVADDGRLTDIALARWNDSTDPPRYEPFGGAMATEYSTESGVRIAGSGTVGWQWNTPDQDDGIFFHYSIVTARHLWSGGVGGGV